MRRWRKAGATAIALGTISSTAQAGGLEFPDNGTQALGRGAAFTAKADDPTAIYYNVAGLATQRGTTLLLDSNINFHSFTFQRAGVFPDNSNDPATPWGGSTFPKVSDTSGPFYAPFLAVTSDFGYFDRLTFALAAFGPSGLGGRTFPLGVQGAPAASRYDSVQSTSTLIYPTLAAAYRVTPWLSLGVGGSVVIGQFDTITTSFTDISSGLCPTPEYQPCDGRSEIKTNGTTFAPSFGAMARPLEWLSLGLNVRAAHTLDTSGTAYGTPPRAANVPVDPAPAQLKISLPWVVRAGARYIVMHGTEESADLEIDATYETWRSAQGDGPEVTIPVLGPYKDIHTIDEHHYNDTWSIRGGGAYNMHALSGVISFRGGVYYDASATDPAATRLDFDTLTKIALTAGLGYERSGVGVNLALAEVFDISRTVTDGTLRPINPSAHGASTDTMGVPFPAVNNGTYEGHMHILSIGVRVTFDKLLGSTRTVPALNEWEGEMAKTDSDKKEEKTDAPKEDAPIDKPAPPKGVDKPKPPQSTKPMPPPMDPETMYADPSDPDTMPEAPKKKPKKPKKKPQPQN